MTVAVSDAQSDSRQYTQMYAERNVATLGRIDCTCNRYIVHCSFSSLSERSNDNSYNINHATGRRSVL